MTDDAADRKNRQRQQRGFDAHQKIGPHLKPPAIAAGDVPGEQNEKHREARQIAAGGAEHGHELPQQIERQHPRLRMPRPVRREVGRADFVEDDQRQQKGQRDKGKLGLMEIILQRAKCARVAGNAGLPSARGTTHLPLPGFSLLG